MKAVSHCLNINEHGVFPPVQATTFYWANGNVFCAYFIKFIRLFELLGINIPKVRPFCISFKKCRYISCTYITPGGHRLIFLRNLEVFRGLSNLLSSSMKNQWTKLVNYNTIERVPIILLVFRFFVGRMKFVQGLQVSTKHNKHFKFPNAFPKIHTL